MTSPLGAALWASSIAGPTALGAALTGVALPLPLVASALAAHTALVGLAVASPSLGAFGRAVTQSARGVALTFDDGPDPEFTPRVLDALAAHGATATFFLVGERLVAHPDVARRVVAEGHAVGAHGWTHDPWYALSSRARLSASMDREDDAHRAILGRAPRLFRPPIGVASPPVVEVARARGRELVAWTKRTRDGLPRAAPDDVARRALWRVREGDIVLLHDAAMGARVRPAGVEALHTILTQLRRLGLEARALEG